MRNMVMNLIDAKTINGKLYVLYQKEGGSYLAFELILREYNIAFGYTPRIRIDENPFMSGPSFSGDATFAICSMKSMPAEWAELMQKQLTESTKKLEAPKLQLENHAEDAEWKDI